jgi:hypothetical protein
MSTQENKAIARRWAEEVWSKGNVDLIYELVPPDYIDHDPAVPEGMVGSLRRSLQGCATWPTYASCSLIDNEGPMQVRVGRKA